MPRSAHPELSDAELLDATRAGDTAAFAVLWERHSRAGLTAARHLGSPSHAEDIVSEAYLRILELVIDGRGPHGAFRPYLYRTVQTIAADHWRNPEDTSDTLDQVPDLTEAGPWEDGAFDRNAAARAFESLNERWQSVLWYTEVEGMPPREVAKLLGLSANGVSALAKRAREALQSAWVEAHVDRELSDVDCRVTLENLQRYQRGKLTAAASRDVKAHLEICEDCARAAKEYAVLNRQLALTLVGILLGGGSAFSFLGNFGAAAPASAATLAGGAAGASSGGTTTGAAAAGGSTAVAATGGVLGGVSATLLIAAASAAALVIGGGAIWMSQSGSAPAETPAVAAEPLVTPTTQADDTPADKRTSERTPEPKTPKEAIDDNESTVDVPSTAVDEPGNGTTGGTVGTGGTGVSADAAASAAGSADGSSHAAEASANATAGSVADASTSVAGATTSSDSGASGATSATASSAGTAANAAASTAADNTSADSNTAADSGATADADGTTPDDGDPALAPEFLNNWTRCTSDGVFIAGTSEPNGSVVSRVTINGNAPVELAERMETQGRFWWSSTYVNDQIHWDATDSVVIEVRYIRNASDTYSTWTQVPFAADPYFDLTGSNDFCAPLVGAPAQD